MKEDKPRCRKIRDITILVSLEKYGSVADVANYFDIPESRVELAVERSATSRRYQQQKFWRHMQKHRRPKLSGTSRGYSSIRQETIAQHGNYALSDPVFIAVPIERDRRKH